MPLEPTKAPSGAVDTPPDFSMSTVTLPSGVTERMTLPTTSLNQTVPSGFHRRPDARMFGRRDPFLTQLFVFELQLESIVVRRGSGALQDGPALEHLHADVPFVLDRFGHELVVKQVEHLPLACRRHVHLDI